MPERPTVHVDTIRASDLHVDDVFRVPRFGAVWALQRGTGVTGKRAHWIDHTIPMWSHVYAAGDEHLPDDAWAATLLDDLDGRWTLLRIAVDSPNNAIEYRDLYVIVGENELVEVQNVARTPPAARPAPVDERTPWTVIGLWSDVLGNQCVAAVPGHISASCDDPTGIETWAEWVWTDEPNDTASAYYAALQARN